MIIVTPDFVPLVEQGFIIETPTQEYDRDLQFISVLTLAPDADCFTKESTIPK
ncbi:MAG: hypothetical protein QM569_10510 [Acidovorax sp.]|uniref:hypothetical protein n=1 Tax=Acidovorax sp. TaxID=1872122 RepID=UPI0039E5FF04